MIPIFARLNGLVPAAVPMGPHYDVDPQRLVDRRAKITYLCTPNNPTSTALSREAVEYVVDHAAGLVVLDEAYAEFAPEVFMSLVTTVRAVARDAHLLEGVRARWPARRLRRRQHRGGGSVTRARGPYKVNALAEAAAIAALAKGPDGARLGREHAALAVTMRERLASALRALGLEPAPSAGNFLFVPTSRRGCDRARDASSAACSCARSAVCRRTSPRSAPSDGHALRIGVGPWESMERVLEALREALACA